MYNSGKFNKITDVKGVTVGHYTIDQGEIQTGVTVIMPCSDNPFLEKLPAASYVINGYGKTAGLVQIDELGTLESPIGLTNTLCVGRVQDALVSYMIARCKSDKHDLKSINVVVGECNDGKINAIERQSITKAHVESAIANAKKDFQRGSVGAGRGMVCHDLKGGIGSASRIVEILEKTYTVGALVLANHGKGEHLIIGNRPIGLELFAKEDSDSLEKGSIMVILATDAALDSRQLKRIAKRATAGIARVGSAFGNGSGDIVIAFSTANRVPDYNRKRDAKSLLSSTRLPDILLDDLFGATIETVAAAVVDAIVSATTVRDVKSLKQRLKEEQLTL